MQRWPALHCGFMSMLFVTETTGCTGSFHLKEQFNLTLTFPVRTEGNSVSNLLLKPNLENKRDKQNIFHLTYFVSLNKKNVIDFVLKKKY